MTFPGKPLVNSGTDFAHKGRALHTSYMIKYEEVSSFPSLDSQNTFILIN